MDGHVDGYIFCSTELQLLFVPRGLPVETTVTGTQAELSTCEEHAAVFSNSIYLFGDITCQFQPKWNTDGQLAPVTSR